MHYIEIDGIEHYSTIPNSSENHYMTFNEDNTFNGQVCSNGYGGNYSIISDNTMSITNVSALAGYCNYPVESNSFLSPYLWDVLANINGTSNNFLYSFSTTNNEETLVITNSENNRAIYGRVPLPENRLPGTWYLYSITKNGVEEINSFNPNFGMDFTLTPGFSSMDFDGIAICNNYFGEYHLQGLDILIFDYFSFTLSICDQNGASLEESYFSFFSEAQNGNMVLTYDISGPSDNKILVLNDTNGDFITYGSQVLSVSENNYNYLSITLEANPLQEELVLNFDNNNFGQFSYQIFSFEGEKMLYGKLNVTNRIDVSYLQSGMYLLVVTSEESFKQTLKFIKE